MGNTKHTKEQIRERIQQKKILFDGAFGTYYGGKYDTKQLPELANLEAPERVREIHTEYLEAGAQILRTNTFAANSFCMDRSKEQIEETLRKRRTPGEGRRWLRGENAPVRQKKSILPEISDRSRDALAQKDTLCREYKEICRIFLEEGADFLSLKLFRDGRVPACDQNDRGTGIYYGTILCKPVRLQQCRLKCKKALQRAGEAKEIDAVGFNCGVGPSHMHRILQILEKPEGKFLTALPNAGYPQMVTGRMIFTGDNKDYFVGQNAADDCP